MCKQKVGLLSDEEKEAIEGKRYAKDKYFKPLQDESDNWVLPLEQIKNNKNIDFWWVRYLPIVEFKR